MFTPFPTSSPLQEIIFIYLLLIPLNLFLQPHKFLFLSLSYTKYRYHVYCSIPCFFHICIYPENCVVSVFGDLLTIFVAVCTSLCAQTVVYSPVPLLLNTGYLQTLHVTHNLLPMTFYTPSYTHFILTHLYRWKLSKIAA